MSTRKHLDIGCGRYPRSPYPCEELYGIDAAPQQPTTAFFKQANLALDKIPFADNCFDSLSAFDFIEHIPRQIFISGSEVRFPFIDLMNEVWRVLKPGGKFYALTPAYPAPEAFQDPTHVNFITEKTHFYFCGENPGGRTSGFRGRFEALRVEWTLPKNAMTAEKTSRKTMRYWHRRLRKPSEISHLLWEFLAIK